MIAATLLGERFELVQRASRDPRTQSFVDELVESDAELALRLAEYDAWDSNEYPGFEDLYKSLRLEINRNLVRLAVRRVLRTALADQRSDFAVVDVQEDDDVRSAVAALAEKTGLELDSVEAYEDLAE